MEKKTEYRIMEQRRFPKVAGIMAVEININALGVLETDCTRIELGNRSTRTVNHPSLMPTASEERASKPLAD